MTADRYTENALHPFRRKHLELQSAVERLLRLADDVGGVQLIELRRGMNDMQNFLTHQLLPHADAENQTVFPLLARLLGSVEVTALLSQDHIEVRALSNELTLIGTRLSEGSRLRADDAKALRRVLYGLAALLRVHLKREGIYLELLEAHLAPSELQAALDALAEGEYRADASRE